MGCLIRLRYGDDEWFLELFEEIVTICDDLELDIQAPRALGRQTTRSNMESGTAEVHLRRCIFIPFLEASAEQSSELFVEH